MQNENSYFELLSGLREKIRQSRMTAAISVNFQLLSTYWEIGSAILIFQKAEGWGSRIIDRLAKDLKNEFPDMRGFSPRNFKYMRSFAEAYPYFPYCDLLSLQGVENQQQVIVQAPLAQLTWYHHITLLEKVKDSQIREFYIRKTIENGWSTNVMVHHIERALHNSQGNISTNFNKTIASPDSELIQQVFKDPYYFDFLQLSEKARERDLEKALLLHIQKVLLELGQGFAFMGSQTKLMAGDNEYYLDLLFYHTKLRRFIVIELKMGEFTPEFAGKMNFYLGLVDDQFTNDGDQSAIGIILCKQNNRIVAEYALKDTSKPIGIAEYVIGKILPEEIRSELPTIAELEDKLEEELRQDSSQSRLQSIKARLKSLQTEELETMVSRDTILKVFDLSLQPLLEGALALIKTLEEDFISLKLQWNSSGLALQSLGAVRTHIEHSSELKNGASITMSVLMEGLKKSGTKHFTHHLTFAINFHQFVYELMLYNYNSNQPFLKKLYHQSLCESEMQEVIGILINSILDQIEWAIEQVAPQ